jgi:hypothetical protein
MKEFIGFFIIFFVFFGYIFVLSGLVNNITLNKTKRYDDRTKKRKQD